MRKKKNRNRVNRDEIENDILRLIVTERFNNNNQAPITYFTCLFYDDIGLNAES